MDTKICCRCKVEKPKTDFGKRSRNREGLEYYCRACGQIEADRLRDRTNELARQRYSHNKEYYVAKSSMTQYKKRGTVLPDKFVVVLSGKVSRKSPKTWDDTLEKIKLIKRANKLKYKEKYKEWSSTENGRLLNALKSQRYRARKHNTINNLTKEDVLRVLALQGNECAGCGKSFYEHKYEIDHVVPVSLGGDTVIENIQLLCRSCNATKRDKIIRYIPEISKTANQSFGD